MNISLRGCLKARRGFYLKTLSIVVLKHSTCAINILLRLDT